MLSNPNSQGRLVYYKQLNITPLPPPGACVCDQILNCVDQEQDHILSNISEAQRNMNILSLRRYFKIVLGHL